MSVNKYARLPNAPRADHMTWAQGKFHVEDGITIEFFQPLKKGTGMEAASSNMMTVLPYSDNAGIQPCIGLSNKYIPAKTGGAIDLYDLRFMERDISVIIAAENIELYNGGATAIGLGDEVAPHPMGCQKRTTGTQARLGQGRSWSIPTSGRGYIQLNIHNPV
jgi:hypothetical protein